MSAHGDDARYNCVGPGGVLKADNPHKTIYAGDRVVKGKIGGGCTINHDDVTWKLWLILTKVVTFCEYDGEEDTPWADPWGYICWLITAEVNVKEGPDKEGPTAKWVRDADDTSIMMSCGSFDSGDYRTGFYVYPTAPPAEGENHNFIPHEGRSPWRPIDCP